MNVKLENCFKCGFNRLVWKRDKEGNPVCKFCAKITDKTLKRNKERKDRLKIYYDKLISICVKSENSNKRIYNPTRSNIAHLFDKSRHKSIENNLINHLFLTIEEHTQFDNLLFKHKFEELEKQFPKGWEIACSRIKKLLVVCEEKTNFVLAISKYMEKQEKRFWCFNPKNNEMYYFTEQEKNEILDKLDGVYFIFDKYPTDEQIKEKRKKYLNGN